MAKPIRNKPDGNQSNANNLTGLKPSSSDVNRTQQAASIIAAMPGESLTTNQGLLINDNQNSLRAGMRGPTLLEDHILREKIMHFDHERIPERVVHARGAAANGGLSTGVILELGEIADKVFIARFISAISKHRFYERPDLDAIVA